MAAGYKSRAQGIPNCKDDEAYKAKLKKGKTTRKKNDPNNFQALFDMMDKTMTKLRLIDTSAWTDEERANFQIALANLKIEISNRQAL